jgi:Sap, sulfolipid-1-addressing protein
MFRATVDVVRSCSSTGQGLAPPGSAGVTTRSSPAPPPERSPARRSGPTRGLRARSRCRGRSRAPPRAGASPAPPRRILGGHDRALCPTPYCRPTSPVTDDEIRRTCAKLDLGVPPAEIELLNASTIYALGVALSPIPIGAILIILSSRGAANARSFAAGWIVGIALAAVAFTVLVNALDITDSGPAWSGAANLLLGLTFLALAPRLWLRWRPGRLHPSWPDQARPRHQTIGGHNGRQ